MSANSDDESLDALRLRMLAVGDQLAAELARENRLSRRAFKHPDDAAVVKQWHDSR